MKTTACSVLCLVLLISVPVTADVRLPSVISDNMVLQQQAEVPIRGWAEPGESVTVSGGWGAKATAKADAQGRWRVTLQTPAASMEPCDVIVQGKNTVLLHNVLIGEVWICSGQSNMEMGLQKERWQKGVFNYPSEIAAANYPVIRLFTVPRKLADEPVDDCAGTWCECSPATVRQFSGTAYFFGRQLHQELNVPIGLLHVSWGGSAAQAWMSEQALEEFPEYIKVINQLKKLETDEEQKIFREKVGAWWKMINAADRGVSAGWAKAETIDPAWKTLAEPIKWESLEGMERLDGVVWYKKQVDLPAAWAGKDLTLHIGPVDDMDEVWFNGKLIGRQLELGHWDAPRVYPVPASAVRAGKNMITVRGIDNTGGGGLFGEANLFYIEPADKSAPAVSIAKDWRYSLGLERKGNPMPTSGSFARNNNTPTLLYNGMLSPVIGYGMRGVIWYQGESNAGRAYQYRRLFPAMIANWRKDWGQGEFPFYYVQIAPWNYGTEGICPDLQEAQLMALRVPNTGMAVTADIGNADDIHPRNKQLVGKRLALWAMAKTYGRKDLVYSGPLYKSMNIEDSKIRLTFDHVGSGLMSLSGPLRLFTIAGEDQKFVPAKAVIDNNTVVVWSDAVKKPVSVRYAWSNTAMGNLYNLDMLPASPFRTDDWPGVTFNNK